ncbi:hypothetical protein LOZ80_00075 [Paenibacillus sp. HWE-109]|uniref:hypothetical protein n=1 Tax=Paenibacillus sp. HWE-109 TaxID=1306526 RepID=UPI001EDF721A|nr:hypothetical protein [Paenibacillus sp. HWE-109]UKS27388.1 hypothetical protein LOZ80_00075 [Paenibacillus sp. HWE-109]
MLYTILIVATLAILAAVCELPALIRQARRRDVFTYSIMLIIGSILSVFALNEIQFPSLMKLPELMYKPLNEWMKHALNVKDG